MKLRTWILSALLVTGLMAGPLAGRAHAQSSESAVGGDSVLSAGGFLSATRLDYGQRWLGGGGAFIDANLNWRLGIEGEATWARWHQLADTHASTFLIGPRWQLGSLGSSYRYRPYVKFLIGDGRFNFPYNYGYGNYFVMAPGAGLDYRLSPRLRLRLADVEYQYWPQFTGGAASNLAVSAGLRFRIR